MKLKKTAMVIFIVFSFFGLQVFSVLEIPHTYQEVVADGTGNYPPPAQGDWIITNTTYVSNENLVIQGNISIENEGSLTLDHTILELNGEYYGDILIQVKDGGELNIINNSVLKEGASQINYDFIFENGSYGLISKSTINDCGWDDGETYQSTGGVFIESDNVIIENSTFENNYVGLVIVSTAPTIENNIIHDNIKYGIFLWRAPVHLIGNNISKNPVGISSYNSEFIMTDNDILDCGDGIRLSISDVYLSGGEISSNDPDDCTTGTCSSDETGKAIYLSYSNLTMEGVVVSGNNEGILSYYSVLTIRNSTFSKNDEDGILGEFSEISLYDNIFANNDGYGIRWKYMELEVDSSNIFIQNYGEGRIRVDWGVKIHVADSENDHVTSAVVTLDNSDSTHRASGFSNPYGNIELDVPEYEIANNGSMITHNPYTLTVKKIASWDNVEYSNQTTFEIKDNMEIDITIPLKKPDVKIDSVDFSSEPKTDSEVKIIVKFTNIGGAQAKNVSVIVSLIDSSNSTTRINSTKITVNPTESKEVRLSWIPEKEGETTIRVTLNTNYEEKDKSNNEMELSVDVKKDVPFYEEPYFIAVTVSSVMILIGIALYLITIKKKSKEE
jgi:hypothetical protein